MYTWPYLCVTADKRLLYHMDGYRPVDVIPDGSVYSLHLGRQAVYMYMASSLAAK